MPATNVLANLFVTIDNTESRRKSECIILPTSKLGTSVLNTLKKDGYIVIENVLSKKECFFCNMNCLPGHFNPDIFQFKLKINIHIFEIT